MNRNGLPEPTDVRRIAIRLTNWVGDVVMNTPFLAAVRGLFPNAHVVALGRRSVAPLLAPHPDVDEVWEIDDQSVRGYREAVGRLRGLRADIGFALPNSLNSAALLRLGGARHVVGYRRDMRGPLLTHPVALRPQDLGVHEVRYYLRLLQPWEYRPGNVPDLKLTVSEDESAAMAEWLAQRGADTGRALIGVNPAAYYGTAKRWIPGRYAEVARSLAEEMEARVVVTGLERERPVAEEVCRAGGSRFYNAAGEMNLRELMSFLSHCGLFLTNDSGAMHVAAALGTPLVAVFGSTDWVTTAPLTENARIVRVDTECAPCLLRDCPIDHRCMERITSGMVQQAARVMLRLS